jgi:Holliday junction resolvase RusA-like endonuclease
MSKQEKLFDDLDGKPLRVGPLKIEDIDPFMVLPSEARNGISEIMKLVQKTPNVGKSDIIYDDGNPLYLSKVKFTKQKTEPIPLRELPTVKQVILGNVPSKSNCYRIITFRSKDETKKQGHASLAKTPELKKYENDFYLQAHRFRNLNIDDLFEIEIDVYYPTQRSDLDNSLKVVLDCLQVINAIKNDNKCTRIIANKFLDKARPRIEFIIKKSM